MDSWTLQGDSYSFLRTAPRTFSLCHRDGTPNHVEIFDIINVPNQSSAISETTCLCDIFGDDCEPPSLSSSPAGVPLVLPQRELEGTAAATSQVDDLNDSSGSYHTAHGSSEGEEGFEDSRERLHSPALQSDSSQKTQTEGTGLNSGLPEVSVDSKPNLKPKSKSPLPQLSAVTPSSDNLTTGERTPSPGQNSSFTLSPVGRASSSSSPSVEKRCSTSQHNPRQAYSEDELNRISPSLKDNHNNPLYQCLTSSSSPLPRNCVNLFSESSNSNSFAEGKVAQVSPEPQISYFCQNRSPLSEPFEPTLKDYSPDFSESGFKSCGTDSSPLPSFSGTELSPLSRDLSAQSSEREGSYSPDTEASSPFPELRRRISLPDLFSRGSTPDREASSQTPELIPNSPTAGRYRTTTPESQDTRLLTEPISTVPTSAPQYTPPSPIISTATFPELVESSGSSGVINTASSPCLIGTISPAKTGSRSPSPGPSHRIRQLSTPSEIETKVSSPVISYSLSPSPEVTHNCSPIELRCTGPSPEIKITAFSPEFSRRDWSSEVKSTSASPLPESYFDSASLRNLTSSPHITGISYSVIQPENRDSPPFAELQRLSTPETDRTLGSSEARTPTPTTDSLLNGKAEPTATPEDSPHISDFSSSALQPEVTHQPKYQTYSPKPKHSTPSPKARIQTPSPDKYQSLSPRVTPVAPSSELEYHQLSPDNLSTVNNHQSHYKQPTSLLNNIPDIGENSSSVDIREIVYITHLEKESVSPSFAFDCGQKSVAVENKSQSPVVAIHSPESVSPFLAEGKIDSSLKHQSSEREETPPLSELKQSISQEEETYHISLGIRSDSPNLIIPQGGTPNLSVVHSAASKSPLQGLEAPQPKFTTHTLNSESVSSFKSACKPEHTRKQISTCVKRENKLRFTEDMAHHEYRRRTPSPPLTRFTPVHILPPEKPYRQWKNRNSSHSQAVASSNSGNLKNEVTNKESSNVAAIDNNSQAHWVGLGMELEMEKQMQLEEEREVVRERLNDREVDREQKREEQVHEKGKGWQGDASYREEQAELSFIARNRKGPVTRRTAPTSREIRQGLPTVQSYSESLLATRRQQQYSLLASQQDPRSVGPSRRIRPSTLQSKKTTPGRVACVASNRPGRSSSSSMGSELDEADNEVKWLTDLAFSSLSSPEVDYLDMYNSSHRSSTNISQPSTQDSPAGVNAAGLAYADFRGSAQKVDNDELSFQEPCTYFSDGLDPLRRNELGSFECVDVAVEREDSRKVRRGVPKRQIQLKRKNNAEGQQDESSENSSPGVPVMAESPSLESNSSETCMRKHITPAPMQECYPSECNPEPNQQNEGKPKLQKSVSLDESCSKTKMATCLIKSVLSKKMQSFDKQEDELASEEVSPSFDENRQPTEIVESSLKESPKPSLSSSLQSDFSISSECLSVKGEPKTKDEAKTTTSIGEISSIRPCSSSSSRSLIFSQSESEDADSECRSATSRSENKSEMKVPFNSKHSRTAVLNDSKTWGENESGELANATARNPVASSVTRDNSMQARMTNRGPECDNTEDHKQLQQGDKGAYTSNTQAITLKAMEKKKASLNVCLTPEADDRSASGSSPDQSFQKKEERKKDSVDDKVEEEEENDSNQVKVPIHKVRDVRRLVKNTYNLSFKAAGPIMSSTANEENMQPFNQEKMDRVKEEMMEKVESEVKRREDREEEFRLERKMEQKEEVKDPTLSFPPQRRRNPLSRPQPMQIEYRAVCSKDEKNKISCNKKDSQDSLDDKSLASPKLPIDLSVESQMSSNANTQNYTSRDTATVTPCQDTQNMVSVRQETVTIMDKLSANEDKPVRTDRKPPMLGSLPRQPSKEREVSTAVVLIRDGSSKTKASASSTQKEISTKSQAPAASPSPGNATPSNTPGTGGHSVSMLLKEKGYQADIGAVVGDKESAPVSKGVPRKHVNCLEIPLQATDPGQIHYHRERTFSASSNMSCPSAVSENADTLTKTKEDEGVSIKPTVKDAAKQKSASLLLSMHEQTQPLTKQKELGDFEAVKRLDPTFPPRSPAIRRVRPHTIEVNSLSKDTHKQDLSTHPTGQNRSQPIEVKSIAKSSQKPVVPPKPSCKFKPVDFGTMPNDPQRSSATTSNVKQQGEERSQTIVVSSPTIYRKISNESTLTSHSTRKLAVSAVSCIKPPPCKTMATTITNISNQSSASFETDASTDRSQLPSAPLQSSSNTEKATTLVAQTSSTDPGLTSEPEGVSDPYANQQVPAPVSAGGNQPSQPAVMDQDIQPQHPRTAHTHEQAMPVASSNTKQQTPISTPQVPGYTHQTFRRSLSSERSQRTEDMHFYASDDPPSYDDRESFSPLMLPDLTTRRSNRYQPFTRPPPCSCTTGCPSHPGLTPPNHHRSPHNLTPPAPTHSPGQALPYPVAQPPLRSHQCRPDPQTMTYQPGSPKSCPLVPSQPPVMYQPLHHPPPCPPHPSLMHACPVERTLQPSQHIDPRRAPVHRSPQQQPPGMAAAPYSDPVHGHSPDLPPMDPQYLCGPQSLGPSYGSEYGGDSSSLYSENSYGQAPRRVLLDPETGKYFYIEVPVQPLRKMLFDPETGQYVEVLIPQQAMSHSGLYPPSAAPYPSLPNPNMYAPAPQYMPYAAPPPPAHPQTELQPPRYPEPSAAATMHPGGSGVSYRNPSAQGSKPEPQNHPPLDQSYLESMYYVPTGMNASPNTTPPDYYHKHLSNLPPTGGKRS